MKPVPDASWSLPMWLRAAAEDLREVVLVQKRARLDLGFFYEEDSEGCVVCVAGACALNRGLVTEHQNKWNPSELFDFRLRYSLYAISALVAEGDEMSGILMWQDLDMDGEASSREVDLAESIGESIREANHAFWARSGNDPDDSIEHVIERCLMVAKILEDAGFTQPYGERWDRGKEKTDPLARAIPPPPMEEKSDA